ncbi:hypothetical protein BamIOP4010DRAFT_6705 [Burkholderia ambifaria IOP40-10]|uniref:Uncharacterized protein n=1 Tax=Burkholderia ambifaria IOP40-10 TaxID=396596 RepID=B1FRP2_9BURK|nr:hypothetical protein BamIOP4010DRAFT_6705 [Burkholderia ambifaria IOP40-10]
MHDDRAAQVTRGHRVEMRERIRERTADRTAERQPRQRRGDQAGHQHDDRQHAQRVVDRFRAVEARLRVAELEIAQRFARDRKLVVQHLELLGALADPVVVARRDRPPECVAAALQRLPLRGDILCEAVLLRAARQREVFLPPRVGLRAHRAAALHRGGGIGRAGQQRGAVERQALARRVHFRHGHVDRARHLVHEDFTRRVVRARHPVHAEHADQPQQHREKRHRQTDARTYRQISDHHHSSCVASS